MLQWAQLFRVLECMHAALSCGAYMTKRDIYYRDVALFSNQRTVDDMVDRIAITLNLSRTQLGVGATSKGLVIGPVAFARERPRRFKQETTLIPDPVQGLSVYAKVDWVLVVEKDAVFETLTAHAFLDHAPGAGCLVTGKGYPDVGTRWMLTQISQQCPT
ncbi:endodeoxyribonuclease [Malassezia cuniculi]|uniref:DNA topoisomerase (ATP-hydrolyzing) n=1 Tax=Malassezia cuniculi TaxID=948313 RepID=A0AAF0J6T7_9BASI|nr:endodeoxyribonuclease [Malassezia cuniculi]